MHIAALVLPVFAVIVTGWIVGRLGILPRTLADGLVQFAYYVAMPALLFDAVAKEPVAAMLDLPFLATFGGASLIVWAVVGGASRLLAGRGPALATVDGLAAAMTNTGFVALPVLHGLFGQRALLPAAIATLFVAVIMFPIGVVLLERSQGAADPAAPARGSILRHTLTNPMVAPTLLGLAYAASGLTLPAMVDDYLTILAGALTPCALFAIGLGLHVQDIRSNAGAAALLTLVKLVGLPALALAIAWQLQLPPFSAVAAVLCAAVPTAKTLFILSSEYATGRELVAATIALTTLASVASLLAWLVLLANLYPSVFPAAPA
ncbi:MAG: AEC family transporter [Geminicoccaceae bacterium]